MQLHSQAKEPDCREVRHATKRRPVEFGLRSSHNSGLHAMRDGILIDEEAQNW